MSTKQRELEARLAGVVDNGPKARRGNEKPPKPDAPARKPRQKKSPTRQTAAAPSVASRVVGRRGIGPERVRLTIDLSASDHEHLSAWSESAGVTLADTVRAFVSELQPGSGLETTILDRLESGQGEDA